MDTKNLSTKPERDKAVERAVVLQSVEVSCSADTDEWGRKDYRTVYAQQELTSLYVDVEGQVVAIERDNQEVTLSVALFRIEGDKPVCVARQHAILTLAVAGDFCNAFVFAASEAGKDGFREGVYGIVAQIGEQAIQSEPVFVMGKDGNYASYFRLQQVGIDKYCEETEAEAKARVHSFKCLDISHLKDIHFYLIAENILPEEWVYEFTVQLTGKTGLVKSRRTLKDKQYISDNSGRRFLCFDAGLGESAEHFWQEGEYRLEVYAFGQLVIALHFCVGQKDIPYDYASEISHVVWGNGDTPADRVPENRDEVLDRLYKLVGLRKVKEEITRICEYADFFQMRRENGFKDVLPAMHMLFTGNPDTGIHAVAKILGELFVSYGFLEHGQVVCYNREKLVKEGYAAEEQLLRKALAESKGGVLLIENAGDLSDPGNPQDRGNLVIALLIGILQKENPPVSVILADNESEISGLAQVFPEFRKCFTRQLYFESYSSEEWLEIIAKKLGNRQFRLTPAAEDKVLKWLRNTVRNEVGGTYGTVIDEKIEEMILRMSGRMMKDKGHGFSKEEMMLINGEDVVTGPDTVSGNSLDKLDSLVGARQLKQNIAQHLNYIYFLLERQRQGFDDSLPPLHMVFSGNAGTGKLTVAKMMGEIYYAAGVLARPTVLVQSAAALADAATPPDQVVGALWGAANGGILYIGEAQLLLKSPAGLACFELLLSYLSPEEHEGTIVILATTPEEADSMMQLNPALKNYFPYRFDFRDYSREELLDIVVRKLKEKKYTLHPKAVVVFKELIDKTYGRRDRNFGNAIWVEKLVEATIRKMSDRIMQLKDKRELTRKELTTVMAADVPVSQMDASGFVKDVFDEVAVKAALDDLQQIVGQSGIKKQIREFVDLARHYSGQGIKLNTRMSLQWCFTGNSGMGKRAIARIIARLYKAMGIIEKDIVYDFKAEKLIGQTEEEAMRLVGDALVKAQGGILLFDEDSRKLADASGFKERVRAILANQLAERPGNCMVVYAGPQPAIMKYRDEVEKASDMVNVLVFEDYTADELLRILKRKLADEHMELTASARKYMTGFISRLMATDERVHASARIMRIVAEFIIRNCIQRLLKKGKTLLQQGQSLSVTKADVGAFTEQWLADLTNERKKIGFN